MVGIFISYRRSDDRHAAGRLQLSLAQAFPKEHIFMDVSGIEPGLDFAEVIQAKVAACKVMLVVIGRGWLASRDRLEKPKDYVRIEIAVALERGVRVVPVLIDAVEMPQEHDLPDDLKKLANRQAISLSHATFDPDLAGLIEVLRKDLQPPRRKWTLFSSRRQTQQPSPSPARVQPPPLLAQARTSAGEPAVWSTWTLAAAVGLVLSYCAMPLLNGQSQPAMFFVASAIGLLGIVLLWVRGSLSATEVALLCLGVAVPGHLATIHLFTSTSWSVFSPNYVGARATGSAASAIVVFVVTIAFVRRLATDPGKIALASYWLCLALITYSAVSSVAYAWYGPIWGSKNSAWLALAVVLPTAAILAARRR